MKDIRFFTQLLVNDRNAVVKSTKEIYEKDMAELTKMYNDKIAKGKIASK